MSNKVIVAVIGFVSSVITAAIAIPATNYYASNNRVENSGEIKNENTNSNSMVVNIDGSSTEITSEQYIELARENGQLTSDNETLRSQIEELVNQNNQLNEDIKILKERVEDVESGLGKDSAEGQSESGDTADTKSEARVNEISIFDLEPFDKYSYGEIVSKATNVKGEEYGKSIVLNTTRGGSPDFAWIEYYLDCKYDRMDFKYAMLDSSRKSDSTDSYLILYHNGRVIDEFGPIGKKDGTLSGTIDVSNVDYIKFAAKDTGIEAERTIFVTDIVLYNIE